MFDLGTLTQLGRRRRKTGELSKPVTIVERPKPGHFECEAREILEQAIRDFPDLAISLQVRPVPGVELLAEFGPQPQMNFRVTATLQGIDELTLSVGDFFFCEWFPCGDAEVRQKFDCALRGMLSGDMRVVEYRHRNKVTKAQLEWQNGTQWRRVATWAALHFPSFAKPKVSELRNVKRPQFEDH